MDPYNLPDPPYYQALSSLASHHKLPKTVLTRLHVPKTEEDHMLPTRASELMDRYRPL